MKDRNNSGRQHYSYPMETITTMPHFVGGSLSVKNFLATFQNLEIHPPLDDVHQNSGY